MSLNLRFAVSFIYLFFAIQCAVFCKSLATFYLSLCIYIDMCVYDIYMRTYVYIYIYLLNLSMLPKNKVLHPCGNFGW